MFYFLLAGSLALTRGAPEVRVAAHTSGAVGVSLVHERAGDSGCKKQATPTRFTWTAKRAYRRARARAREGPTWYRGKWHNADTLNALNGISNEQEDRNRQYKQRAQHRKQHCRDKRIRILSINVGGMTTTTWNELHAWLNIAEPDSFDIVTIQETHWKQNSEFNSGPWTVVGTGCAEGDRCAGVMTMVHKRLGNSQCVMHREILKGRMQHVRVLSGPTAIDIVNTYQHVWRTQYDQERNLECRMRVWNALRRTVTQIPLRNTAVWCGDFNLAVNTCLPHVGTSIIPATDKQQLDEHEFYGILQQYGLCVLNTWSNPHKATCTTNGQTSQIDYILTRMQLADRCAKQSKSMHEATFGTWKTNRRYPVRASVPMQTPWRMINKQQTQSKINKTKLQEAVANNTEQAQRLHQSIAIQLQALPAQLEPGDMTAKIDAIMMAEAVRVFPAEQRMDMRTCNHTGFRTVVQAMWHAYRQLRKPKVVTLANIWQAWRQHTIFVTISKEVKSKVKQAKREKVERVMVELEQAARRGDQYQLYQSTKKLAPWKPHARIIIRGKEGQMLNHEEQLQEIQAHAKQKFCQQHDYYPGDRLRQGIQIDEGQLQAALAQLPTRKAAPPGAALSALWRLCSVEVAQKVKPGLDALWRKDMAGTVPSIWRDTDLAWLPKPTKDTSRPENLRPIGLIHPLSKAIATVLRLELRPVLEKALEELPQFAYTRGRSTTDALLRIHGHGSQVGKLLARHNKSIYALKAGQKQCHCAGGISFSLDLAGAFDSVPRRLLAQSLFRLGISHDVIHVLMAFHHEARYWTTIAGHRTSVTTTQGIKQGCKIAPFLFVSFTVMVMQQLQQHISKAWVKESLTIFADDHWAAWKVDDRQTLRQALRGIQTVIKVLEDNGLQINAKKSAILYDLKGKDVMKEMGTYIQKTDSGKCMLMHSCQGQIAIPIKKSHEYLGTVFAYRDSQNLNLQHRLGKSRGQYASLRRTIHAKRLISKTHRYRVWTAGVLTSATYGLHTVGLSTSGKTQLQAMVSRQLRALAALPAHTTHVTNSAIREQFGFTDVIQQLCDQATKHMASLEQIKAEQPGHICVQEVAMQHLDEVIRDLAPKERHGKILEIGQDDAEGVCCPECGICFATLKGMRQHRAAKHKIKVARNIVFQPELHAMAGLPQCSGCHHKFQTWDGLRKHIEQGSCRTPLSVEASASAANHGKDTVDECAQEMSRETDSIPLHSAAVQTIIREQGWEALMQSKHAATLKQHCCICGRWIVDPVALKRHIKGAHKATWEQYQHQLQHECSKLQHTLSRDKTCQYCGRTAYSRHYHQCCVIFQSAFLGLYHHGTSDCCDDGAHQHLRTSDAKPVSTCADPSFGKTHLLSHGRREQKAQASTTSRTSGPQKKCGDGRTGLTHGEDHHQPRGPTGAGTAGQGLHAVHGADGTGGSADKSIPGQPRLAPETRGKAAKPKPTATAHHTPLAHDDGTDLAPQHPEKQGWMDEQGNLTFQVWDPTKKALVTSATQEPIGVQVIIKDLEDILGLISPDHILKFHAQRPLKGMAEAENKAVFNLEVSLRAPGAHQLYNLMLKLAGNSCWMIIGAQVRKDSLRRSGAVQALQKMIHDGHGGRKWSSTHSND